VEHEAKRRRRRQCDGAPSAAQGVEPVYSLLPVQGLHDQCHHHHRMPSHVSVATSKLTHNFKEIIVYGLLIVRLCFVSDIVFYCLVDSLIDCIVLICSAV